MTKPIVETIIECLKRWFVKEDAVYDYCSAKYQAKTPIGKMVYLSLYLLPGILVFIVVNIGPLFRWEMAVAGGWARNVQYLGGLIISVGCFLLVPFVVLRLPEDGPVRACLVFL